MFANLFRFIALFVALQGYKGWAVFWNRGLPTAKCSDKSFIRQSAGKWQVGIYDDYAERHCIDWHPTLKAVFEVSVITRLDAITKPFRSLHTALLAARGNASIHALLWLLKDGTAWEMTQVQSHTEDGKVYRSETIYRNSSGWIVSHYWGGDISAMNSLSDARISYTSAGWIGYWFVVSGSNANCLNIPSMRQKYPLGGHTLSMFKAYRGI